MFIFNYALQPFQAYCAIRVRRSNFYHQASPLVSPRRKMEFCLNADFHITFRDLLYAVKLRHGTDGFTSPQKEDVLRIFFARFRPGANPRTWVPKATTLPLDHRSRFTLEVTNHICLLSISHFKVVHSRHFILLIDYGLAFEIAVIFLRIYQTKVISAITHEK
jgi:hypothetical protein